MLGSTVIEIGIGLSLIYVLLSLMCTVVAEAGSRAFGRRGSMLRENIARLLGHQRLADKLYKHALIVGISKPGWHPLWRNPDHIPSPVFARVLLDIVTTAPWAEPLRALNEQARPLLDRALAMLLLRLESAQHGGRSAFLSRLGAIRDHVAAIRAESVAERHERDEILACIEEIKGAAGPAGAEADPLDQLRDATSALEYPVARDTLGTLLADEALKDVEGARGAIARWFEDAMLHVTESYKRQAQLVVFLVAAILAVVLNVDTIGIANRFAQDKTLRERVADLAEPFVEKHKSREDTAAPLDALEWMTELEELNAPIGWVGREDVRKACDIRKAAGARVALARATGAGLEAAEKSLAVSTAVLNELALRAHFPLSCDGEAASWTPPWKPWLLRITGWLMTALAASLGARFWFDVLGRLVDIRKAGRASSKSKSS